MFRDSDGPIEFFEWGRFVINGAEHSANGEGVGKDICIIDGVVTPWEERKGHRLKPKMVARVLDSGIQILIIGNGVNGALKVPEKIRKVVSGTGIPELIVEKTPKACDTYNRLFHQGKTIALLAHGTC